MNEVSLEVAEKILDAAERWARDNHVPCSIAIVDGAGAVVVLHRMDGVPSYTTDVAINKAWTAANYGMDTLLLSKKMDPREMGGIPGSYYIGMITQSKLRLCCVPGGRPVRDDYGRVIGAIGVSGVPESVGDISDTTVCRAGVSALYD